MPLVFALLIIVALWTSGKQNIKLGNQRKAASDEHWRKTNARRENILICDNISNGMSFKEALDAAHIQIRKEGFIPCLRAEYQFPRMHYTEPSYWIDDNYDSIIPDDSSAVKNRQLFEVANYVISGRELPTATYEERTNRGVVTHTYVDLPFDSIYGNWPETYWKQLDEPHGMLPVEFYFKVGDYVMYGDAICRIVSGRLYVKNGGEVDVIYVVEPIDGGKSRTIYRSDHKLRML